MTVGKPEYNLDSFGIRYVKKDVDTSKLSMGKTQEASAKPTGSTPSTTKLPKSGMDAPKDSLDLAGNNPLNSRNVDTTTSYGEGNRTTPSMDKPLTGTSGNPNQSPNISGKIDGKKPTSSDQNTTQGDKKNTGANARTSEFGTYDSPKNTPQNNKIVYKKPEGGAGAPIGKARLQLAINKCKLLKLKAHNFSPDDKQSDFQESKADSSDLLRVDTPRRTSTGEVSSNQSGDKQQEVGRADTQEDRKTKAKGDYCPNCGKHKKLGVADNGRDMGDMTSLGGACPNCGDGFKPKEKGTGDKIPAEKLGDLPVGKVDEKEVGGTEIEDQHGKTRKLQSPHEAYKSEVREMAIDAIDMAMKTIAVYQDAKEKAIQEELIKEAYQAQEKLADAGGITTSDGVNAVYSDVHQKKINKE